MNVSSATLVFLGVIATLFAPLKAAYIQKISFGYDLTPIYSGESGHFAIQYRSGFDVINGQNGSIDWMTMTIGTLTRDLVRNQIVVADYFGFAFTPATGHVEIGNNTNYQVGFAPGYFMYSISSRDWEIRHAGTRDVAPSSAYAPINYFRAGVVQQVPENGGTGVLMFGGLLGLCLAARKWRQKTRRLQR